MWSCCKRGWKLEGKGFGGGKGHVKTIPSLPHYSRSNLLFFQANHSLSMCMHIQLLLKTPINMHTLNLVIFKRILWCSQTGSGQEISLAKFGYILDTQVRKKKCFHILGYLLELSVKIWWIWVIFFMKNPLYRLKIIFFSSKFHEISTIEEILTQLCILLHPNSRWQRQHMDE
jgi:hypothetical protein